MADAGLPRGVIYDNGTGQQGIESIADGGTRRAR